MISERRSTTPGSSPKKTPIFCVKKARIALCQYRVVKESGTAAAGVNILPQNQDHNPAVAWEVSTLMAKHKKELDIRNKTVDYKNLA